MKTPFEEKGWTKNSLFRAVQGSLFALGEMVWLSSDDETEAPYFTNGKDTYAQYFERFEYLGEKDEMSREKVVDKSAPHMVAVVKFYNSDGTKYPKEYHYKCDSGYALKFQKNGAFDHECQMNGEKRKIRIVEILSVSKRATKALPLYSSIADKPAKIDNKDLAAGDRVRLDPSSSLYGRWRDNPKDCLGTVREIDEDDDLVIDWDNGEYNYYTPEDQHLIIEFSNPVEKTIEITIVRDVPVKEVQIQGTITRDFKVGDEVKIRKGGRWDVTNDPHNPQDMLGKIVEVIDKDTYIRVLWENKNHNGYNKEDLVLVCNEHEIKYRIPVDNPLVIKDNKISKSDSLVLKTSEGRSWTDLLEKSTTAWNTVSFEINKPTKEEINMSNQVQLVNIKLFDDDAGLKPTDRVVSFYANFATTSNSSERTLANALIKLDIIGDIAKHNEKRAATVDLTVLKNTGNKVFLQPIEFDDLRTEITKA